MRLLACTALIRRHEREQSRQHELHHDSFSGGVAREQAEWLFILVIKALILFRRLPVTCTATNMPKEKFCLALGQSAGAVSVVKLIRFMLLRIRSSFDNEAVNQDQTFVMGKAGLVNW